MNPEKRNLFIKLFQVTVVSFVVGLIYFGYIIFIGIPKTQARNYYNLATKQISENKIDEAKQNLEVAISFANEEYIQRSLDDLLSQK